MAAASASQGLFLPTMPKKRTLTLWSSTCLQLGNLQSDPEIGQLLPRISQIEKPLSIRLPLEKNKATLCKLKPTPTLYGKLYFNKPSGYDRCFLFKKKHFHEAGTPLTKNTAHAFSGYNRSAVTPLCCDNVSPRVLLRWLFIA